jgi:hypothetical protein
MSCCNDCGSDFTLFSGSPGLSAYELAVANGYVGTEAQWLLSFGIDYIKYTALISQAGTAFPTKTILGTNSIGNIVWTREGVGRYIGTLDKAFPSKTWKYIESNDDYRTEYRIVRVSDDVIRILTYLNTTLTDGLLQEASLEIRVYP